MKNIIKVEIPEIKEYLNGVRITGQTLIASSGDFPRKSGNCFTMLASDNKQYQIINFICENLQELVKSNIVNFPVKIAVLYNGRAIVIDERIPDKWYPDRFCEVCCPRNDLPITQRLKIQRDETTGRSVTYG